MNRDAILATLIGFGIGLLITGGFLLGPTIVRSLPKFSFPPFTFSNQKPKATPTPETKHVPTALSIDSPLPDTIEDKNEILVSGNAPPDAIIVIAESSQETVVTAGSDGKFAGKISLIEGENDIALTSYKDAKDESQRVTVFYTPEQL